MNAYNESFASHPSDPYVSAAVNCEGSGMLHFEKYQTLATDFSKHHMSALNVLLHLVTTPLGVLGFLCLVKSSVNSTSVVATCMLVYLVSLLSSLSLGSFLGTLILCSVLLILARSIQLNSFWCVVGIAVAYKLQDLAHDWSGETTFQASYTKGSGEFDLSTEWLSKFMEHTYFLLPLCVDVSIQLLNLSTSLMQILSSPLPAVFQQMSSYASCVVALVIVVYGSYSLDSKNRFCFFPGLPTFQRVLTCDLYESEEKETHQTDIRRVREWVMEQGPSETTSTHYWFRALPGEVKESFARCAEAPAILSMFHSLFSERHYCVDVVEGMNEVYVTGPERFDEGPNSDQIFDMRHVDGPWGVVPFVSVYRCLIGMDRNHVVKTMCPFPDKTASLTEGKVMGFDFNREVHYIARDYSKQDISDKFRVTLKCHYCVYPRVLAPLGWLMHKVNVRYNMLFRSLFLATIKPESAYDRLMAYNVNINTYLMDIMESYVGEKNLIYLAAVGLVSYLVGSYTLFLSLTSFIHYMRYISTYAVQKSKDVDFGCWKRDALLFKTLSLAQLWGIYLLSPGFTVDYIGLAMAGSGYIVSMMATKSLGIDRTYFGAELGVVQPRWVDQFPYGYIPHPMILSQVWALLGLYHASHMRSCAWPWLVPVHICFYLCHMMQEHFGVYIPASLLRT